MTRCHVRTLHLQKVLEIFESSKYTHHDMICRVLAGNGSMSVDNILYAMKEKFGLHLHQRENVKNTLKQRQCFEETSPTRFCHRPALCKDFIRSVLSGQIVHRSDQRRKLNLDMYHIGISKLFRSSKHVCSMAHILWLTIHNTFYCFVLVLLTIFKAMAFVNRMIS